MGPILGGMPRLKFDPTKVAITVDGNSLSDPYYSDLWLRVQALAPINDQITITNLAHSGDDFSHMEAGAAAVDAAYVNGKTNILPPWEMTNNIYVRGRTGPQTIADLIAYINARQAYVATNRPGQKPWYVILPTAIPRGDFLGTIFTLAEAAAHLDYCNDYIRQNYRAMGARAFIEMRRPGGPFDFTDVSNAARFTSPPYKSGEKTHLANTADGYGVLAGYIADALKRLPAR
jgi:hypothetical protein